MISVEKESPEVDQRLFSRSEVVTREYIQREACLRSVFCFSRFSFRENEPNNVSEISLNNVSNCVQI